MLRTAYWRISLHSIRYDEILLHCILPFLCSVTTPAPPQIQGEAQETKHSRTSRDFLLFKRETDELANNVNSCSFQFEYEKHGR